MLKEGQKMLDVLRSVIMDTLEFAVDSVCPKGVAEHCANPHSQRTAVIIEGESAGKVGVQVV